MLEIAADTRRGIGKFVRLHRLMLPLRRALRPGLQRRCVVEAQLAQDETRGFQVAQHMLPVEMLASCRVSTPGTRPFRPGEPFMRRDGNPRARVPFRHWSWKDAPRFDIERGLLPARPTLLASAT